MEQKQFPREELVNALTHGIGAVASLAGGSVLVTLSAVFGGLWQIVSVLVYSGTLLLLYTASTLYHAVQHEIAKRRLRVFDHCAIYLLIAGTYTPFLLLSLRGALGWTLFALVWLLAGLGVLFKLFWIGRFPRASTATYLAMGWMVVFAARPLLDALSAPVLVWLALGGLAYTAGTVFFHSRRIRYAHAIWHLFVLTGSVCHFVAISLEVLAPAA